MSLIELLQQHISAIKVSKKNIMEIVGTLILILLIVCGIALWKFHVPGTILWGAIGVIVYIGFVYNEMGKGVDFYLLLLLLIISIFSQAFFNLGTNWSIRKKYFKKISLSKMSNSITLNSSRVVFGFLNWGSFGLILSFVLSLIVGETFFLYDFLTLKFI